MSKKHKLSNRCDSTSKYPFYTDKELLAIERQEVHIPSDIGDVAVINNAIWDIIDSKIDADMSAKRSVP